MKFSWRRVFIALAAVLIGNAIYWFLMPYLPQRGRHAPGRLDWGLLVDFWICVLIYNLLLALVRKR
ncbi:MAG TPA: hypothetical protein VI685_04405 [Candidatus Angelobacter sp.]